MIWPFSSVFGSRRHSASDFDRPLLAWSRHDALSVRHSFENTAIIGQTGSGKTSSSGRLLALSMLREGFGGMVLSAKSDERKRWEGYAAVTGRQDDVRVIEPEGPWRFNVLDGELSAHPSAIATNVASLLTTVMDRALGHSDHSGGDRFWRDSAIRLLVQASNLLLLSQGCVTIGDLYRVLISMPRSPDEARSDLWKQGSFCFRCLRAADERTKSASQARDFELVSQFFLLEMSALAERTRSSIVAVVTSVLDPLQRGFARELIAADTTIDPAKAAAQGRIVIVDLPTFTHREAGVMVSILLKTAFQRAVLSRDLREHPRPLMLWMDEYQHYCVPTLDSEFLATNRSARMATVLLTQNINLLKNASGEGERGRSLAEAVLGNCATKVWHANSCPTTNEFAANVIGKKRQFMSNGSSSHASDWAMTAAGLGERTTATAGFSEHFEYDCPPAIFPTLKTGGPDNNFECQAIVTTAGRCFKDTCSIWRPVTFSQK